MNRPAVKVEGLSKLYRLGTRAVRNDTLAGAVISGLATPFRNYRRLSQLGRFDEKVDETVLWALKDVSFSVEQGEVLGIIGRNGAGKSTLLKVLSRITPPTSGQVTLRGRVASLLEVGTGFHPEFTGRENIFLNGTILGMTQREIARKMDSIVDFAGVDRFLDTPVKRYSSGMYVRLAFAVAAHLEPEILVVDEVLAVGDAEFQAKCIGKMRDVSRAEGRTVLFVSHNTGAIRQLCTRVLMLDNGARVHEGEPGPVIEHYLKAGGISDRATSWAAEASPATDELDLLSIAVLDSSGESSSALATADELFVEIQYRLKTGIRDLRVTVTLLSGDGTEVFISSDFLAQPSNRTRPAGMYRSICRIPGNLLNAGNYVVSVDFEIPMTRIILHDQRVGFTIPELSVNQLWRTHSASPPGVIHPTLEWRIVADVLQD